MKSLLPPNWAPNAVATNQGWVHPKTGEILISRRGLLDLIEKNESQKINLEFKQKDEPVENVFIEIETATADTETTNEVEVVTADTETTNEVETKTKTRRSKKNITNE